MYAFVCLCVCVYIFVFVCELVDEGGQEREWVCLPVCLFACLLHSMIIAVMVYYDTYNNVCCYFNNTMPTNTNACHICHSFSTNPTTLVMLVVYMLLVQQHYLFS